MEAIEYLKLATDKTEAGDLIKDNNLTDAVVKLMSNYAEFRVKNCSIPAVSNRRELLCAFFKYFRDNGEANIGMSIEQFVDDFLITQ